MNKSRVVLGGILLTLGLIGAGLPASGRPADAKVTLRSVKYAELAKEIRGLKGKVVLVDFWAQY